MPGRPRWPTTAPRSPRRPSSRPVSWSWAAAAFWPAGRGHLGDGTTALAEIRAKVLGAAYRGFAEAEIFSQGVWDAPADDPAATVRRRFDALLSDWAMNSPPFRDN